MKKNTRIIEVGIGKMCPKCNGQCIIRKRVKPPKEKNFFYKQWDFCKRCNAVYFEEKYKCGDWQEYERQLNHFEGIKNETLF